MPTYEYKCNDCGIHFERVQKMSDAALTECPTCKGKVRRLISAGAGLIFKGSGFYITDYRSEGYKQQAAKEGSSGGSSSSTTKSGSAASSSPAAAAPSAPAPSSSPAKPTTSTSSTTT